MDGRIRCTALRTVNADRIYRPGEPLELDAADAAALEADGAVEVVRESPANSTGGADPNSTDAQRSSGGGTAPGTGGAPGAHETGGREETPAPPLPPAHDDPRPTDAVKGIGAKAAAQLAAAGVTSIGALASLADADLTRIATDLKVVGNAADVLAKWRDAAIALAGDGDG